MKPRMRKQMIVAVPDDELTEEQIEAINEADVTLGLMVTGTRYYFNRLPQLILTDMNHGEMTSFCTHNDLDWKVLITEGSPQSQTQLLKYFEKVPVYDEDGNVIGEEAITDLSGILHTFSGHKWDFQ